MLRQGNTTGSRRMGSKLQAMSGPTHNSRSTRSVPSSISGRKGRSASTHLSAPRGGGQRHDRVLTVPCHARTPTTQGHTWKRVKIADSSPLTGFFGGSSDACDAKTSCSFLRLSFSHPERRRREKPLNVTSAALTLGRFVEWYLTGGRASAIVPTHLHQFQLLNQFRLLLRRGTCWRSGSSTSMK